ncbi:polysaccharide pyruvyl transferase family protein [Shewanella sp. 4_MG-2023]|uniref:polysaccharide pyruvyl transferase family protein n=1 Tax=Shewanella sp. 4_MG-2023 TaxID=3062652 RepID=UPI0026E28696|nr:polysaccharide pyruvyl transferase family protein [Shewanella sp. 4_MG-2023]MDO6678460.1 polysaccharide pyruvyl transferase family protein [Shewanella sp. 4_MG-2023]
MKNIAIVGALWTSNFGDVLLAKLLKDRLENLNFNVFFPNASDQVIKELKSEGFEKSLKNIDYLFFCGGGYFSEPPGNSYKWALSRYKALFHMATYCRLLNIPYSIIGVGAGPINSNIAKLMVKHVIAKADVIALRDVESILAIRDLNKDLELELVSDYVLSLRDKVTLQTIVNPIRKVGVHITNNGMSVIPAILKYIESNKTDEFYFIEDHVGEFDLVCVTFPEIKKLFLNKIVNYVDVDKFICDINSLDFIITSKLHVGIVASALNKRVCSLPYHAKVKRLYESFGRADVFLDDFSDESKVIKHITYCSNSEKVIIPKELIERSRRIDVLVTNLMKEKLLLNQEQ